MYVSFGGVWYVRNLIFYVELQFSLHLITRILQYIPDDKIKFFFIFHCRLDQVPPLILERQQFRFVRKEVSTV